MRNTHRFRETYGELPVPDMPSIEQRLLENVPQSSVSYYDQYVSTGSRHLSPNPPSISSDQYYGYNPNAPLVASNPHSAYSNLLSASPNPSVSPYHLSSTSNPPSLYSNPSPYPINPSPRLPHGVETHTGSFQDQPIHQQVDQGRRSLYSRVSPPSAPPQRRPGQGIFPIPEVDYENRAAPVQTSSLPPVSDLDPHYVSSGHLPAGSSLQMASSSASVPAQQSRSREIKELREPIHRWFRVTDLPEETTILVVVLLFKVCLFFSSPKNLH